MAWFDEVLDLIFNNPITSGIGAGISSGQHGKAQDEANFMTDQQMQDQLAFALGQMQDVLGVYNSYSNEQLGAIEDTNAQVLGHAEGMPGKYNANRLDFLGGLSGRQGDIAEGYGDRYRFAEDQIRDFGQSRSTAIDRAFDNEAGAMQQNMLNRGLSSSQGAMDESALITERRTDSHQRLQDDLMRNRVDILSRLSGEGLSADQQMSNVYGAYDAAMRGDTLGADSALSNYYQTAGDAESNWFGNQGWNLAQLLNQGGQNVQNVLGGFNFMPPGANMTPGNLGTGAVDPVNAPGQSGLGQAGDVASMIAAAMAMFGGSDRNIKHDIEPIDDDEVLKRFESLPVSSWKYNGSDEPHIGPMAQDFQASFGLGDGKMIPFVDAFGVLTAAVRALSEQVKQLQAKVA